MNYLERGAKFGFPDLAASLDLTLDRIRASGVPGWHPLILGIILSVIAIALAFPRYRYTFRDAAMPPGVIERAMEWKFEHPLQRIPIEQFLEKDAAANRRGKIADHLRNRDFRIAVPLVANSLGLGIQGAVVLEQFGAFLFLTIALLLLRRITQDELLALLAAVYVATTFPGQWGFNDFGDDFDGIAYLALLISVWSRSSTVVLLATVFGGLTDERAILVAPLVYLCHSIKTAGDSAQSKKNWLKPFLPGPLHWAVIFGVIVFGLIRIFLGIRWGAFLNTSELSIIAFRAHAALVPLATLNLVKGGVFILAAWLLVAIAKRELAAVTLTLLALVPILGVVAFVDDFTRSLAYGFLAFFIAMVEIVRNVQAIETRRLVSFAVICSLCVPTYYLIEGTIYPMLPVFRVFF